MHLDTLFWERNTENPPERYNQQNSEYGKVYMTNELFLQNINYKNKGKPTGERDVDITTFKCMGLVCILILSMKENPNL